MAGKRKIKVNGEEQKRSLGRTDIYRSRTTRKAESSLDAGLGKNGDVALKQTP